MALQVEEINAKVKWQKKKKKGGEACAQENIKKKPPVQACSERYAMLCYAKSLQLCPTLCDPIDSSPPGSPVPEILQARTLEWVAISFSNA